MRHAPWASAPAEFGDHWPGFIRSAFLASWLPSHTRNRKTLDQVPIHGTCNQRLQSLARLAMDSTLAHHRPESQVSGLTATPSGHAALPQRQNLPVDHQDTDEDDDDFEGTNSESAPLNRANTSETQHTNTNGRRKPLKLTEVLWCVSCLHFVGPQ